MSAPVAASLGAAPSTEGPDPTLATQTTAPTAASAALASAPDAVAASVATALTALSLHAPPSASSSSTSSASAATVPAVGEFALEYKAQADMFLKDNQKLLNHLLQSFFSPERIAELEAVYIDAGIRATRLNLMSVDQRLENAQVDPNRSRRDLTREQAAIELDEEARHCWSSEPAELPPRLILGDNSRSFSMARLRKFPCETMVSTELLCPLLIGLQMVLGDRAALRKAARASSYPYQLPPGPPPLPSADDHQAYWFEWLAAAAWVLGTRVGRLRAAGCVVMSGVDATKLDTDPRFRGQHFPWIHFNMPYGLHEASRLVHGVFISTSKLQRPGDRIYMALVDNAHHRDNIYDIEAATQAAAGCPRRYVLSRKKKFIDRYASSEKLGVDAYAHSNTLGNYHTGRHLVEQANEFIFRMQCNANGREYHRKLPCIAYGAKAQKGSDTDVDSESDVK